MIVGLDRLIVRRQHSVLQLLQPVFLQVVQRVSPATGRVSQLLSQLPAPQFSSPQRLELFQAARLELQYSELLLLELQFLVQSK